MYAVVVASGWGGGGRGRRERERGRGGGLLALEYIFYKIGFNKVWDSDYGPIPKSKRGPFTSVLSVESDDREVEDLTVPGTTPPRWKQQQKCPRYPLSHNKCNVQYTLCQLYLRSFVIKFQMLLPCGARRSAEEVPLLWGPHLCAVLYHATQCLYYCASDASAKCVELNFNRTCTQSTVPRTILKLTV